MNILNESVKPFVKWAGGKGKLLPQLIEYYPEQLQEGKIKKYIEPFVGGGAVLINILQNYDIEEVYAFDINKELINTYNVIKNDVGVLITKLEKLQKEFYEAKDKDEKKQQYLYIREKYNTTTLDKDTSIEKAAEFIFLNKTCFNGLYRVNKNGRYNVPMGDIKNPTICDEKNLRNLSKLIQKVTFEYGDYKQSKKYIDENTFLYFDPPYRPLNVTSGFTSYTKEDFNEENQIDLARFCKQIDTYNCKLMLSNSDPKNINEEDNFFEDNYDIFNINRVNAKRSINSNGKKRGNVSEVLITNYEKSR